ncbi:MAG: flagellar export chaperone FliS [bacterium]|nr:flagellar export chaperone FliS [bacterium]
MMEGDLYLKNRVEGMNNDELILFIYQEMLKVLKQTLYFFEKNDIEKRVNAINKGIEVINALLSILNFEEGGEIALRLRSLYLYSIKKLTSANCDRDPQPVNEVLNIFKNLHSGWAEKIENDRKNNVNAHAAQGSPMPGSLGTPEIDPDDDSGGRKGLEIYG